MSNTCYHKVLKRGPAAELEIEIQRISAGYEFTPNIHDVVTYDHLSFVCMDHVEGHTLYYLYGDNPDNIPEYVWFDIQKILSTLFLEEGIEYIDITPFNFIQTKAGKIIMIDFGHAYYTHKNSNGVPQNWVLKRFLAGEFGWNPDFA